MERAEVVAESAAVSGGIAKSAPVAIGGTVSSLDFFWHISSGFGAGSDMHLSGCDYCSHGMKMVC